MPAAPYDRSNRVIGLSGACSSTRCSPPASMAVVMRTEQPLEVGCDVEATARHEGPGDLGSEPAAMEEAALPVAGLRPRVREVDVVGGDGGLRQDTGHDAAGVAGDDADVGDALRPRARGQGRGRAARVLDREEVGVGALRGEGEQDVAATRPDLHLHRTVVAEHGLPEGRRHRAPSIRAVRRVRGAADPAGGCLLLPRGRPPGPRIGGPPGWQPACTAASRDPDGT